MLDRVERQRHDTSTNAKQRHTGVQALLQLAEFIVDLKQTTKETCGLRYCFDVECCQLNAFFRTSILKA